MSVQFPWRALLLDLDDTLVYAPATSDVALREAMLERHDALDAMGIGIDQAQAAFIEAREAFWSVEQRARGGRRNLLEGRRQIVRDTFERLGKPAPALAEDVALSFHHRRNREIVPIPGAADALRRFRAMGVALAVITNGEGEGQRRKLDRCGMAGLVDAVLIEGELGICKPDPEVYHEALRRLGERAADAAMAGDNIEWDVRAPQRLGIFGIWVNTRADKLPAGPLPDRTVQSIAELLE